MMKALLIENVETAPLEDLLEAQKAIGQAIRVKQEALQAERAMELQALAQRYGLKVKVSDSTLKSRHQPKYQHPETLHLTWCGRGMRPHWFKELEQQGVNRKELLIPPEHE
jgi:DNA-binding protein H-NS